MSIVQLTVNGRSISADTEARTHLADFLRETHNLTGTHIGCEHGVCGACTVLVDGEPARSCITFALAVDGAEVTTIEGLDDDEIAGELRAAFKREHGLQCGYCTPGMIVAARDVVARLAEPDEQQIRIAMSGNLCRCTGYVGIIRAIRSVIADRRGRGIAPVSSAERKALGPVGAGHAGTVENAQAPKAVTTIIRTPSRPDIFQSLDDDWKPQASFEQSFSVTYPADEVWAFFGDVDEVAACLPGAVLTEKGEDGRLAGHVKVKVGPIGAEFAGQAQMERDDASRTGHIRGAGKDRRSGSATKAAATYRVVPKPDGNGTEVNVTISYALTGMLAQFGRSGLVEDVASRITKAFAANLEARLKARAEGTEVTTPMREIEAGSLMGSIVWGRVRGFFTGLFGR